MKLLPTKRSATLIFLLNFFLMHYSHEVFARTIKMSNFSSEIFKKDEIHVHNTASWCPDSRNEYDLGKPGNTVYEDNYGSIKCRGTCFDWFEIRGNRFYIPNQCGDQRIEIMDDGSVYLNGSKAGSYGNITSFFTHIGNETTNAFKDLGADLNKGFSKLDTCIEVATLSTELAAKIAAQQTILSGDLTDAILATAQESAVQPLIGARKGAEQVLEAAKGFLEKAAKPIATGSIEVARQTASGTLKAGESASVAVLTATDQATQTLLEGILKTFKIEQLRYEGSLQKLASGNLGNVQCKAVVVTKKIDFNFDLNIQDPITSIETLAHTIADKIVEQAKKSAIKAAKILHAGSHHQRDDLIKLTLWHHTKKNMPLELAANNEEIL